jgi:hypothetical protein
MTLILAWSYFFLLVLQKYNFISCTKSIREENVYIGMNLAMCQLSWGKPQYVNTTTQAWGTHEQWVYGDTGPFLYFENGILTTIQN